METRACTRCNGTGISHHDAFTGTEGRFFPALDYECHACEGKGTFPELDVDAILASITTAHGGNGKRRFRKSAPDHFGKGNLKGRRAYFVWRLARFHGGADVCMPVTAECLVGGDPFEPELNALADAMAKAVFGTTLAAAHRWGMALGFVKQPLAGLPASAYPGGPSYDDNKPEFELMETR